MNAVINVLRVSIGFDRKILLYGVRSGGAGTVQKATGRDENSAR
jgi:hypothetical protein